MESTSSMIMSGGIPFDSEYCAFLADRLKSFEFLKLRVSKEYKYIVEMRGYRSAWEVEVSRCTELRLVLGVRA